MKCPYCKKEMILGWECTNPDCTIEFKIAKQEKRVDTLNKRLHYLRVDRAGTDEYSKARTKLDRQILNIKSEIEVNSHILNRLKERQQKCQIQEEST